MIEAIQRGFAKFFLGTDVLLSDCPDGDIREAIRYKRRPTRLKPGGIYYMEDGLGVELQIGDQLESIRQKVVIREVSAENGLVNSIDLYTLEPFQPGEQVAEIGKFESRVTVETLRYLLKLNLRPARSIRPTAWRS